MILSSSESSVCLGKHSVMWVITSCDSSVFLGNIDFCIRRVTYTGLRRKKICFSEGKEPWNKCLTWRFPRGDPVACRVPPCIHSPKD